MKNKHFILSVLAFFIATMLVAVPWHLILFHDKYLEMGAFTRHEPIMLLGMTAVFLQACVFSYFYPIYLKYINENVSLKNSIKYSLLMGINVWTVMVFATAAKFKIEPVFDFIIYGTAFQTLQFVSVGVALFLVNRNLSFESAT